MRWGLAVLGAATLSVLLLGCEPQNTEASQRAAKKAQLESLLYECHRSIDCPDGWDCNCSEISDMCRTTMSHLPQGVCVPSLERVVSEIYEASEKDKAAAAIGDLE